MLAELRRGLAFTIATMALFGGGYHVGLWALGQMAFASQAEGSLVRRQQTVIGSRLIAQAFTRPEYFHPRPSAVEYSAAAPGGSNFGPSNRDHLAAVERRLTAITTREGVPANQVPSEMVTASGGGLDPHIPPAAADLQARRVAAARGVPLERLQRLIQAHIEPPTFGFVGRARVNVLELNLALDDELGSPSSAR